MIAFNSVLRYKGKQSDPQTVGRELNVRTVLMSRLVQRGDELSISTELIDVRDNRRLWGERYERNISNLPSVPRELAKQITNELRLRLTGEDQKHLDMRSTENTEAYQLYLKGRYYWNKGTRDGEEKAVGYFQQAIYKDPNYARAYSGLADCYIVLVDSFGLPAEEGFSNARAAATKALELDDTLAEAHTSLAAIKDSYDWDWPGAEQEHRRAIELNPNYLWTHRNLGLNYEQKKMFPEAIAEFEKVRELSQGQAGGIALGHAYAVAGKRDEAFKIIDRLQERKGKAWAVAPIYAGLGEKDQAFEWLEKAYEEHDPQLIDLKVDPRFDNVRSDPRFTDLLRRMKLNT